MKANPNGVEDCLTFASWPRQEGVVADTDAGIRYLKGSPRCPARPNGSRGILLGRGDGIYHRNSDTASQETSHRAGAPGLLSCITARDPSPLEIRCRSIQAPVLANYGEKDPNINKGIPDTEAAMKKYNKVYDYKIYPGAQHGFNNEYKP